MKIQLKYFTFTKGFIHVRKTSIKLIGKDIIKKVLANFLRYKINFADVMYQKSIKGTFLMKYISTPYTDKVYLPLQVIKDAVDNDWIDSLCYYVWLKKLHYKPVFYAYSLRKISAGINCSPTTVKTHISVLKSHGLVDFSAGNLILKSTRKLATENKMLVAVGVDRNKANQRDLIRFTLIKRNLHTQFKSYITKNNVLQFLRGKWFPLKQAKALYKKSLTLNMNVESSLNGDLTLSNNKIGSICHRSQSTGIRIQKSLNRLELVSSFKRVSQLLKGQTRRSFFNMELDGSHFLSKSGTVFKRLSNGIILRERTNGEIVLFQ